MIGLEEAKLKEPPAAKNDPTLSAYCGAQHRKTEDGKPWTDFRLASRFGRLCLEVRFKVIKQDPRMERPEARGGGDWVVIGDVPDTVFSILSWYKLLMGHWGRRRDPTEPMFMSPRLAHAQGQFCSQALDSSALLYSEALASFRDLLVRVQATNTDLGLHSLRVSGYNASKAGNGEDITVAHGGWKSNASTRYDRFTMIEVVGIAARMMGCESAYVETVTQPATPRELASGPRPNRASLTARVTPPRSVSTRSETHGVPPGSSTGIFSLTTEQVAWLTMSGITYDLSVPPPGYTTEFRDRRHGVTGKVTMSKVYRPPSSDVVLRRLG